MASSSSGYIVRKPDSQGRIAIGNEYAGESFAIEKQNNGNIVLKPVEVIHKQESWLFKNQDAAASVKRGLDQAAAGQTNDLGTFAQFADGDDED